MRLVDHPEFFSGLRAVDAEHPLRVLVSGCIAGLPCGVDGTDYGMGGCLADLLALDRIEVFSFCPEDAGIGTPRTMPDLHDGDGRALLEGRARVLDEHGRDWSTQMRRGAEAMLAFARQVDPELCILTDMSAACGTQVISLGCRFDEPRRFQRGMGVAATMLSDAGYCVVSQRDARSLARLRRHLGEGSGPTDETLDHHETEWVKRYFGDEG